jgi:hypothetical protein
MLTIIFSHFRCHLAGGRYARFVALRQLLSAADHGNDVPTEHTDSWLEPAGTRRVLGLRVHHLVDSIVLVYQHGRAQVQARLSSVSSPSSHPRHLSTPAPSFRYRSGRLARTFARVLVLMFFFVVVWIRPGTRTLLSPLHPLTNCVSPLSRNTTYSPYQNHRDVYNDFLD